MGGNLSTQHDRPTPTPTHKKEHTNESLISVPFMELLKPACMKIEKRKKKMMMMKNNKKKDHVNQGKLTLEDWLFPSSDREYSKINAVHVRKHSFKVLPVSSSPVESNYVRVVSSPRESFSIDGHGGGEIASFSQMSGLAKKRVTFKLPDMADIFVYHVPGDEEFQLPV